MTKQIKNNKILRFSLGSRLGHGVQAISFTLLLITGSSLVFKSYGALIGPGGLKLFSQLHHILAYVLTFGPILLLILFSWDNVKRWIYDCIHWTESDVKFVAAFPKIFFGLRADTPKQGKFNGGEKINSILQILGTIVIGISGWIMLLGLFSPAVAGWAHIIHSFAALVLSGVVAAHAYLALIHPGSKESINGMLSGYVDLDWAADHHALWVEEVMNEAVAPLPAPAKVKIKAVGETVNV
ncbi:MAG: cytochrome b/b6 domain-containing protein [Bacillota bacterium]